MAAGESRNGTSRDQVSSGEQGRHRAAATRALPHSNVWQSVGNRARSGERPAGSLRRREEGKMDGLWSPHLWGTPVGLGIFFFLMGIGIGVFFWGLSKVAGKKE